MGNDRIVSEDGHDGPPLFRKRVLAFAGRNGCGKETAARIAANAFQAPSHTYSDILYETFELWGFARAEIPRPDLDKLSTFMRELKGQDCMAKVMDRKVRVASTEWVVIDGVRRLEDIATMRAAYGTDFTLVWIEAPADLRYTWLKARKDKKGEQFMTREEFDAQERTEPQLKLSEVRAGCDREIDNGGTLGAYQHRVRGLLLELEPVAYG